MPRREHLGLRELFPIYSLILNRACMNLRKVTLKLAGDGFGLSLLGFPAKTLWTRK